MYQHSSRWSAAAGEFGDEPSLLRLVWFRRAVSAQDFRLLNNAREVRNRSDIDVDGSAYCRIFGRFRPVRMVRMVSKRGAMPHQSVCRSGRQIGPKVGLGTWVGYC